MSAPRPPRLSERILVLLLPYPDGDAAVGDLREEYRERVSWGASRLSAGLWHLGQALAIATRVRFSGLRGPGLRSDARTAVRQLVRQPGYSLVIITAVALGIGVNAVLLAVADGVFLEPLPYPAADRLGIVSNDHTGSSTDGFGISYLNIDDVRTRLRTVEEMALYLDWQDVNLSGTEQAHRIPANFVTSNYFAMMGLEAHMGRVLAAEDNRPGAAASVAVLTEDTWERVFGADPTVLGRAVLLNGTPFEVVGIVGGGERDLRQRYRDTGSVGIYLPLEAVTTVLGFPLREERGRRFLNALVRLRPGVAFSAAQAELLAMSSDLAREFPEANEGWSYRLTSLSEAFFEEVRTPVLALLVGATLVLLLVSVNLANVVLIRATGRAQEWAMRQALGAGRARLLRQLVAEAAVLTFAGGIAGLLLGNWGLVALLRTGGVQLPAFVSIDMDLRVALSSLGLAVGAGAFIGLVAATGVWRQSLGHDLRESGRSSGSLRARHARSGLILAQVGLAFVLLVGAGLMLESFRTLRNTGYGFDTEDLLLARTDLRGEAYAEPEDRRATAEALLQRAAALPGVEEAFLWSPNRLGYGNWVALLTREDRYELYPQERIEASRHSLRPGTLAAVGIPLLAGRDFGPQDTPEGVPVAIVSESLGRALWPEGDPVGRRMEGYRSGELTTFEVVGVVADARHRTRLIDPFGPQLDVYFPYSQASERFLTLALRSASGGDPTAFAAPLRQSVREVDPDLPVYELTTMESVMRNEEGRSRLAAMLVGLYATLAVLLAGLGIYGVLAHAVRQQTREIGIRLALGARVRGVVARVMGSGLRLTLLGVGSGALAALGVARLLESALYGVDPWNPWIFVAVAILLPAVAVVSCLVPALRAVRVDPVEALRVE